MAAIALSGFGSVGGFSTGAVPLTMQPLPYTTATPMASMYAGPRKSMSMSSAGLAQSIQMRPLAAPARALCAPTTVVPASSAGLMPTTAAFMPAMTTVVPAAPAAPVLAGIEMRPLSEDRIRRVAPVYKDRSIPPPAPVPPQPDNGNVVYDDLMGALEAKIPPGVRICVLGGTAFKDDASQPLVEALAAEFSVRLADSCVLLTGGMSGVQETFAKGCAAGPPVVNMLPKGQASNFGVGVDFAEFADLDERIAVFGQVGDIYISVEGGPGVAKEARAAYARNAVVLPMISTGGASGGKFDFPPEALEQPAFATQEQWDCVKTKGSPEVTAQVVVDIISAIIATSSPP